MTTKNALAQTASKEVSTTEEPGQLPDFLKQKAMADAGKGVSNAAEDNIVPIIYLLQGLSPQVNERNDVYVEGAKPGDIWMKNAPIQIAKGREGFDFQPCFFTKDWVKWVPRDDGGGFRGRYPYDDLVCSPATKAWSLKSSGEKIKAELNPDNSQMEFWTEDGCQLVETRYYTGYVYMPNGHDMPYVIPFKSTGHTIAKNWMGMIRNKHSASPDTPDPIFLHKYRLTSIMKKNTEGEWFVYDIKDAGNITSEAEYNRGAELFEGMSKGTKKIEDEV